MPTSRKRGAASIPAHVVFLSLLVCAAGARVSLASAPNARAADASRISVTAVAGEVDVTMAGRAAEVRPESTVALPARIVTGNDGMLGLTQAGTNITVAGDTDVEIPAEAVDGNLIARLVQHRGNVFYDVAHRDVGKLRVETPFLVAVIKGTQFNVAVQADSTTISLFEGRLEIRTPDGSDVIQLNAGEIAIRSRVDESIRVIGMNDARIEAPRGAGRSRDDAVAAAQPSQAPTAQPVLDDGVRARIGDAALAVNVDAASPVLAIDAAAARPTTTIASIVELGADGPALDTRASADIGLSVDSVGVAADLNAGVDLGAANVATHLDAGVDLGAGSVDLGASADFGIAGVATADVGLDTGVDLGAGSVDLGASADLGIAGVATADVGLDTGVDLGAGTVDIGASADLGVGDVATADVGLDTGVDLGAGSVDLGLDTTLDLGGAAVDADLTADVDLSTGTVDAGVDVAGVNVDVGVSGDGVDLGVDLGAVNDVVEPVVEPITTVVAPILEPIVGGGLLGGLLGRR